MQLWRWLTFGTLCWLQGVGLQAVIQRDVKVLSEADTQAVMAYLRVFRCAHLLPRQHMAMCRAEIVNGVLGFGRRHAVYEAVTARDCADCASWLRITQPFAASASLWP